MFPFNGDRNRFIVDTFLIEKIRILLTLLLNKNVNDFDININSIKFKHNLIGNRKGLISKKIRYDTSIQ